MTTIASTVPKNEPAGLAPAPPIAGRVRAAAAALGELAAWRSEQENGALGEYRSSLAKADAELSAALLAADAKLQSERQLAESRFGERTEQADEKAQADEKEAVSRHEQDRAALAEELVTEESTAKKTAQESAWLAETLCESAVGKIRSEFEQLGKRFSDAFNELSEVEHQAERLLREHKHAPLPKSGDSAAPDMEEDASPEALNASDNAEALKKSYESARTDVAQIFPRLVGAIRPPTSGLAAAVVAVLIGMAGGGTVGGLALRPVTPMGIGLGVGVGAAVMLGIFWALRAALRARVAPLSVRLAASVADARRVLAERVRAAQAERSRQRERAKQKRDNELRIAKEQYAAAKESIESRRDREFPALKAAMERTIASVRSRREEEVARAQQRRQNRLGSAEAERAQRTAEARAAHAAARAAIDGVHRESWERLVETNQRRWREITAEIAEINASTGALNRSWDDPAWDRLEPPTDVAACVRFGTLTLDASALPGGLSEDPALRVAEPTKFVLPAVIEASARASLMIQHAPETRADALRLVRAVMLRTLVSVPPGKVRFTIADPVGLGESFAAFMHLADSDPKLVTDRIWTDIKHIEQRLTDLTEHMETVIQKYLRNEFSSIDEYNRRAGEIAEPYRYLVLADYPAGLSEEASKRLASIVASGPRCGVFTLISADARARPQPWLPTAEIERTSAVVVTKDGRLWFRDRPLGKGEQPTAHDLESLAFVPDAPPSDAGVTPLLSELGKRAIDAGRVQVPFESVAPDAARVWSMDSGSDLRVSLGRSGATRLQQMTLGRGTSQHALIAGRTGSGKSTLLHAIITNTALWYSPDQVELYLIDFKKGVEFKTYATHGLPHARVIAVESEREFGLSVLRRLDEELRRRGALFRDAGVQDLGSYRKSAGSLVMPRTLLIVDEFQELFVEDDKVAQESALLLDRLVRQGRAFGMHAILGSQTLGGAYSLARSTIGQMAIRVALQCSEADAYLIMSEDNSAPRLLSRPGEAIYNDASGQMEGNSPFQVVWLPDEKREGYLAALERRTRSDVAAGRISQPAAAVVFEGNAPAAVESNRAMSEAAAGRGLPKWPCVWLGDPVSIKDATSVSFTRQAGSNMLTVCLAEEPLLALAISSLLSLRSTAPRARIFVLDGSSVDSAHASMLGDVCAALGEGVRRYGPRDAAEGVAAAHAIFKERETTPSDEPVFVVVHSIQRLRPLRKSEDDFGFSSASGDSDAPKADRQLGELMREGPGVGVHVLLSADTAANLDRMMDRRSIREFEHRVLFQMSANDSSALIDGPQAGALGQHRAILFTESSGQVEKFRPYALPEAGWLAGFVAAISARG